MNAVDICNLALGRIGHGASNPIQSLTESSEAARACNRLFQPMLQAVLREVVDWPFARAAVALTPSSQTVPGWGYVYAYPANAVRVQRLSAADVDPFRMETPEMRVPFKLMAATDGESQVIATDLPAAWCWYTIALERPEFGDALFQDALTWKMAAELALALKVDPRLWQSADLGYRNALGKAAAAAENEGSDDLPADSAGIRVRA